ncbi:phospholipid carrier-dependent glycosyltransferase [Fundidesulfovibrio magnetotacticus]|nr:glycosyltransferase family 39 protein [Fundidesulfovibrio magnetotacticus]
MLSTLNASLSPGYILDLCWNIEVHPPGYYLFKHFQLQLGASDVWLRLPSALAGLLCLPLAYRLGMTLAEDRRMGHLAMAMLAFNPLHVWVSRQTRPYGLIALAAMALTLHLARWARGQSPVFRASAVAWNGLFASMHFTGILFLGAQLAALALMSLNRLARADWRGLARYAFWSLACIAPSAVYFLHARFVRADRWISNKPSVADSAAKVYPVLKDYLFLGYQGVDALWMAQGGLVLAGALLALRGGRRAAIMSACLAGGVFALLILGGYAAHLTCTHLSFLLPASTVLAAYAAHRFLERAGAARVTAAVPVALLTAFLVMDARIFYSPERSPADLYGPADRYRAMAGFLAGLQAPGVVPAFDDQTDASAVLWYGERLNGGGRVLGELTERDPEALLCYFAKPTNWRATDCCIVHKQSGLDLPFLHQGRVGSLDLYFRKYRREPVIVLRAGDGAASVTANPDNVLVRALDFRGLSVILEGAGLGPNGKTFYLSPSQALIPGECVFRFDSEAAAPGTALAVEARGSLLREGNSMEMLYRVDSGAWQVLGSARHLGEHRLGGQVPLPLGRHAVDVKVVLVFGGRSAFTMYEPATQARFHGVTASLEVVGGTP